MKKECLSFVRVCVEIDARKALKDYIIVYLKDGTSLHRRMSMTRIHQKVRNVVHLFMQMPNAQRLPRRRNFGEIKQKHSA